MKTNKIITLAMTLLLSMGMVSCSEDDGVTEEFENWQEKNETFFSNLSADVKTKLQAEPTRTDWKRIKSWTKLPTTEGADTEYIIVKVVESAPASETESPAYTDSVAVHYQGNLLPSTNYYVDAQPYPLGLRFDATYQVSYDEETSVPTKLLVGNASGSALIPGFATAMQNMRRGDHWIVYIPYQLGYGTQANNSIPAFSTLIFDIRLADFWH